MLQQNDIDALLAAFAAAQEQQDIANTPTGKTRMSEVKLYDFAEPDNLPSEFVRALENINLGLARTLAGVFSGYLSVGVSIEPLSSDQMTYRQFCNSVPESTVVGTFAITPLEGIALFELNPHIAWFLIERGLGGLAEQMDDAREFTPLEKGLLEEFIFRRVMREIGRAWRTMVPMAPVFKKVLTNPTVARIAQPDDRLVVCSFGINIGEMSGMCAYCMPVSSLDFERLLTPGSSWEDEDDELQHEAEYAQLLQNLQSAALPVRACLPDVTLTLGELSVLREGDVIHLDADADDPIEVRVGDACKFTAQPVTLRDKVGIEIVGEKTED